MGGLKLPSSGSSSKPVEIKKELPKPKNIESPRSEPIQILEKKERKPREPRLPKPEIIDPAIITKLDLILTQIQKPIVISPETLYIKLLQKYQLPQDVSYAELQQNELRFIKQKSPTKQETDEWSFLIRYKKNSGDFKLFYSFCV